MPRYYAAIYPRGMQVGEPPRYCSFPTRASRDAWAAEGPGYSYQDDYREAVRSSDPGLRVVLRSDRTHNWDEVARIEDEGRYTGCR